MLHCYINHVFLIKCAIASRYIYFWQLISVHIERILIHVFKPPPPPPPP